MTKTVFITGASSGIGKATALFFQRKGWQVAATMRNPKKETVLNQTAHIKVFQVDVTDVSTIKKAVADAITIFGSIDVVVNNAGFAVVGAFELSTPELVQKQFATNVFGTMNVTREVLPHFRQKKSGIIVNISSIGGKFTVPFYSLYHATKFAIEGFSEGLQHELIPFNIKVKIVEPGPIQTDFYGRSMDVMQGEVHEYDQYIDKAIPELQKSGATGASPEAVANVIYQAATDQSSKLRYPAGTVGKLLIFIHRMLPESIFYFIMRKQILG